MTTTKVPALYEMETVNPLHHGCEATGIVYFFCPDKDCRDAFFRNHPELNLAFGWDGDYIPQTVCSYCSMPLVD